MTAPTTVRRNSTCPFCRFESAVFWARASENTALYRCFRTLGKAACGHVFEGPMPESIHRLRHRERMEAAA